MKTAARTLILAGLVGAACSGEAGDNTPGNVTDTVNPTVPGMNDPSVPPGPGGTGSVGDPSNPGQPAGGDGTTPVDGPSNPATVPGGTGDDGIPAAPSTGQCQVGVPATTQIPRLTNLQYDRVVKDIFGVAPDSGGSWSESFEPDSRGELPVTQWGQYRATAERIAAAVMNTPLGEELAQAAADRSALEASVRSLGRQVFRRPVTDDEVASLMTLADVEPAGTPAEIAEMVVYTMLISPSFLMQTEFGGTEVVVPGTESSGTPQTAVQLTSHQIAARLAFLIWNTVPDEELNAAADADQLQTVDQIRAQAERMLGAEFHDKVAPVLIGAHRLWANIEETSSTSRWGKTPHDSALFPEYSDAQPQALMAETDRFFADVAFDGEFEDLFLSNVAYVNQDTAPLYGLDPSGFGPELQRVELDPVERPGFITRGAFLSSFAHERNTSPILRGTFILSIMGGETPAPDPRALEVELPPGDYKTNREAVAALTSVEPSCQGCHENIINPPGFVLENFSAVGSIQTVDPEYGGPIDTAVDAVAFPGGPKPVANAYELMTELAASRRPKEIYAQKWVSYATGRDANDYDLCLVNVIADKLDAGGYPIAHILADITQAESFRLRVAAQ